MLSRKGSAWSTHACKCSHTSLPSRLAGPMDDIGVLALQERNHQVLQQAGAASVSRPALPVGVTHLLCSVVSHHLGSIRVFMKSHEVGTANVSAISASSCPYQSAITISFAGMLCSDTSACSSASLPHLTLHSLILHRSCECLDCKPRPHQQHALRRCHSGIEASQFSSVFDELGWKRSC